MYVQSYIFENEWETWFALAAERNATRNFSWCSAASELWLLKILANYRTIYLNCLHVWHLHL